MNSNENGREQEQREELKFSLQLRGQQERGGGVVWVGCLLLPPPCRERDESVKQAVHSRNGILDSTHECSGVENRIAMRSREEGGRGGVVVQLPSSEKLLA